MTAATKKREELYKGKAKSDISIFVIYLSGRWL